MNPKQKKKNELKANSGTWRERQTRLRIPSHPLMNTDGAARKAKAEPAEARPAEASDSAEGRRCPATVHNEYDRKVLEDN